LKEGKFNQQPITTAIWIFFSHFLINLRISVEEALRHPYMADYHLPEDEPTAEQPFDIEDNNDSAKTLAEWRGGIIF
jgi:hypothetical protein